MPRKKKAYNEDGVIDGDELDKEEIAGAKSLTDDDGDEGEVSLEDLAEEEDEELEEEM